MPNGQFGTRIAGGKDHASARYIFTQLSPIARHLFNEHDDALLNFLHEEGQSIEPEYYLPIIPLVLVNGADGIGTGWATSIPCYDPREIVKNLRQMMRGNEPSQMHPSYKGYTGQIERIAGNKCQVKGIFEVNDETELSITELPLGKWTRDYKEFLEELMTADKIDELREYHTQNRVHFVLNVPKLAEMVSRGSIEKDFKLWTSLSLNNFVAFNPQGRIMKYESEMDILKEFFGLRKTLYEKRKEYLLARMRRDYEMALNKVNFI